MEARIRRTMRMTGGMSEAALRIYELSKSVKTESSQCHDHKVSLCRSDGGKYVG